ncbi:MAG: hypothetical protein MJY77_02435 [Bacteroidaceae bacterium]|nr:hypothetical protein [Bacteroidaceae bacterium]
MINRSPVRKTFSFLLLLLVSLYLHAQQIAPGEWLLHSAYHNATKSVKAFSRIFVLSDGALYSYNYNDNSIQTYDKVNILNDNDIADIEYCNDGKVLIIGYKNGNIDLLSANDDIYNIPDIVLGSSADKCINEIKVYGKTAYISFDGGIAVIDMAKREISDTYTFTDMVYSTLIYRDVLVCSSADGIFYAYLRDNLKDPAKWNCIEKRGIFPKLLEYDGQVVVYVTDKGLFYIDVYSGKLTRIDSGVESVNVSNSSMYVYKNRRLYVYVPENTDVISYAVGFTVRHVLESNNTLWISAADNGLQKCTVSDNSITVSGSGILPDSPKRNFFDYMNFSKDGRLFVAGGSLNYFGVDYAGTLMIYKDSKWNNFNENGIEEATKLKYINITCLVENVNKPGNYFAGSARHGLYEFHGNDFYKLHTFNNSGLTTIIPKNPYEYVSVDGLQYDGEGNLWMLNNEVDTIIKILKSDGTWTGLYYKEIAGKPTFKHILFDNNNLIWTAATRYSPGLFCIDTKGTVLDDKDDVCRFSGSFFTNQDNVSVTVNDIFFFEKDLNGIMWIGTDQGIFILDNPDSFIKETNTVFKRIKIPRNDGSGLADYLLDNVYASAICIDAGNRKWIGTKNHGIFLIDNTDYNTLFHFTTENSPLLSDNILNIKIKEATGEVYIATDKGLCVFGGNAFKSNENLEKSNITVFPNPITPETDCTVYVKGLAYNSTVKILNSSGRVVYEGKSDGGGFTWNCGNSEIQVPSGIYYIMVISEDNRSGVSKTVTIIR